MHLYLQAARGVQLDQLVADAATGAFRSLAEPKSRGGFNYHWLSADDFDRYHDDRQFEPFNPVVRYPLDSPGVGRWHRACDVLPSTRPESGPSLPVRVEPTQVEEAALFDMDFGTTATTGASAPDRRFRPGDAIPDSRPPQAIVAYSSLSPFTRCSCNHAMTRHKNTKFNNNSGTCLWAGCACESFEAPPGCDL